MKYNRRRINKILTILMALALIAVSLSIIAYADVGNVGADDDYGGGDSDSDGLAFLVYMIIDIFGVPGVVIAVIVVAVILFLRSKKRGGTGAVRTGNGSYAMMTSVNESSALEKIKAEDEKFSKEQFITYANDVYIKVQEAWESKNLRVVRPYESDKLFALHESQIKEFIDGKKTNHLDGQCILSTEIADFRHDGGNDVITVRLNATLLDYTTSDESGEIILGSNTQRRNRAYRLEFIRTTGVKTETSTGLASHECPSCGAPIEVNNSGQCEYCKNVITSGEYGWVLNAYSQWM